MPNSDWKRTVRQLGLGAESAIDRLKTNLDRFFGGDAPITIQVYQAFGTAQSVRVFGRVLKCQPVSTAEVKTMWTNLHAAYRRFETDEIPHIPVRLSAGTLEVFSTTDEEGYFLFELDAAQIMEGVEMVQLSATAGEIKASVDAQIELISSQATFGIVSDIDDTIVITQATSLRRMIQLTLLESARTRVAFSGVSDFYKRLQGECNPFFYVSSSPWNLYQFLIDFMNLNKIPTGAMFLRDFGLDQDKFMAGTHKMHKVGAIEQILDLTGELPLVLVGDSGQRDPEVYADIARRYPKRIRSVYIRDVTGANRDRNIQILIDELHLLGIDMLLVPDTRAAVVHASANGLIEEDESNSLTT